MKVTDELKTDALTENLDKVLTFVDGYLEQSDCSVKSQMQIDIAVEEIFVNIAHYAYKEGTGYARISVELSDSPAQITITFADAGFPYDPLAKKDPDITLTSSQRKIGGLGIYIVKKTMDDVAYQRINGENVFTITKKLS